MPWDGGPGAGFTTGRPWLPLIPGYEQRNVAAQSREPDSVFATYRRLLALRAATPALQAGSLRLEAAAAPDVLAWVRELDEGRAAVAINFATRERAWSPPPGTWRLGLSTAPRNGESALGSAVVLKPLEALIALPG
jgi:alpha-glucosidase